MVRYADGPTTEVSTMVDAAPATVWRLVSDPALPANFSDELVEASWNPAGPPPGLGAEIHGRTALDGFGEWTTTSYVITWDQEREFSWAVGSPDNPAAVWSFLIEADPDGGCRLTQRVRLGPGPSNLVKVIDQQPEQEEQIIEFRLALFRPNMEANLNAYKALAEGTKTLEELTA